MASGTIKGTKQGYYGVEIDWVATANSASANTSTVVSKVYITYYSINIAGRTATSSINGASVSFAVPAINDKPNASTRRLIYTHTATVAHNTDGTKTGVTISASFPFNLSSSSYGEVGTLSASQSVNFDTIARTSTLSLPSTTLTTDTAFTATITRPDSTFRNKLAVLIDGTQKAITDYFTATSYSYTIPSSFIPADNSDEMVLRLYTYTSSGTTAISYVDKPVTVNVLSTLKPTVSISAAIASGGLNGYYVQNKSTSKLTLSATASSGSTIKSYTFTGPNVNASTSADSISVSSTATSYNLTTGVIKSPNTLTYQVTVYDARGRYATATVSIYVYQYAVPEITTALIQRCDASGVLSKDGTYVKYNINSKFSPVLVGTTINNWRTVTICHSSDGGATYGSATTLQAKTTTDTSVTGVYGGGAILTSNSYKFKIVITDQYGATDTEYVDLGSLERPINFAKYGNGIALGGFSSVTSPTAAGLFECNWPMSISSDLSFNKLDTEQSIKFNDGGSANISTKIYKGSGNSSTALGAWDLTNDSSIWSYGTDRTFYINRPTYVFEDIISAKTVTAANGRFTSTTDASETSEENVALRVGNPSAQHMDIDGNEIIAKKSKTELDVLYLVGSYIGLYGDTNLALTIGSDTTGAYLQSAPVYKRTYTGSANIYVNSDGTFGRSTASSERYKKDIENVTNDELNPYKILDIPVRQFRYNEENVPVDGKPDDLYIGLVAEEVNKYYPSATEYTEDGQVEMWNIKVLFPALLKIVQDQQKEIEALKQKLTT